MTPWRMTGSCTAAADRTPPTAAQPANVVPRRSAQLRCFKLVSMVLSPCPQCEAGVLHSHSRTREKPGDRLTAASGRFAVCGRRKLRASDHLTPHRQRSEEHTSELQSRLHLVCRLLLEKKNRTKLQPHDPHRQDETQSLSPFGLGFHDAP